MSRYTDHQSSESRKEYNRVIAICDREAMSVNPEPSYRYSENNELILIGSEEAESRFFKMHSETRKIKAS
jgi:K+/H+ antiporter YhaU regulatory subunit KhtT